MKRFEYSPLGKELKAQSEIAKKQYQGLDKLFKSDKPEITDELNLLYDSKHSFCEYGNDRRFYDISLESKYYKLLSLYHRLYEFRNLIP